MYHPFLLFLLLLVLPVNSIAAFGLMVPSDDIVSKEENAALALQISLFDPLQSRFLELAKPKRFGVQHLGEQTDLLAAIKPAKAGNVAAWNSAFTVKRPGDYTFYAEYPPDWQAADEQYTVHSTKLCVNALGLEEGWDEPVGLEGEIIPLSRPYGLWVGNLFSGQVLLNGEPAPYVMVAVAWLGPSPEAPFLSASTDAPYRIQTVRADTNGVFHYAMPAAGWWGFAATMDADWTIKREGEEKPVSLVTSYWVQARNLK
jgi:cobalt/nickel transport protein